MSTKFEEHVSIVLSIFPAFGGLWGFVFYSFLTYLGVLFIGWLLNPTVDKIIADDLKAQALKDKGKVARERNKAASAAAQAKLNE